MRSIDNSFIDYDYDEEKQGFINLYNVDNMAVYDTYGGANFLASALLISGTVGGGDDAESMVGAYSVSKTDYQPVYTEDATLWHKTTVNKNLGPMRPFHRTDSEGDTRNSKRRLVNKHPKFFNLTPADFLAGNTYDLYCPLYLGGDSENKKTIVSIFRRSQWQTMGTDAESRNVPCYNYDRFFNYAATDTEVAPHGFDNLAGAQLATRYPSEFIGSTAGTNTSDTDTASGSDLTSPGVHNKSQTIHDITIEEMGVDLEGVGEFRIGDVPEYKLSYLYDGFQDSPLSSESWDIIMSGGGTNDGTVDTDIDANTPDENFIVGSLGDNYEGMILTIKLPSPSMMGLSKRVTDLLVWRRNNSYDEFRFIKQLSLSTTGQFQLDESGRYVAVIQDKKSFGTYESITGIPETVSNTSINHSISASVNDFLFVSGAWHPEQSDIDNFIFRSQPGKFSVFNWASDFLAMPSKPLALAGWGGKLYVFSREYLYRVNPDQFFIESVNEGIGILNSKSVVVTDYGMFFCDANNMYHHDGTSANPIGDAVLYNESNPEGNVGYKRAVEKALQEGYQPIVQFDGKNHCVYFIIQGYNEGVSSYTDESSRAYCYSFKKGRWDYLDMPAIKTTCLGRDGETILLDGHQIWNFRNSNHKKRTWSWDSKLFDMGTLAAKKTFKSIKFAGSPTVEDLSGGANDDIKVYLDGVQQKMTLQNKNYPISEPIANFSADQNYTGQFGSADSGAVYTIMSALPSKGAITPMGTQTDSFVLNPDSMPEFVSGTLTSNKNPVKNGEIEHLKYISPGQYLYMEMTNSSNNRSVSEIVKVKSIYFLWNTNGTIQRVEVLCERGQLGTNPVDFESVLATDQSWEHASIRYVGASLKFPRGAKGSSMQIKLRNQKGNVDSISFVYRLKTLK